jgi:hypothetical protein
MSSEFRSIADLIEDFYREAQDDAVGLWEVKGEAESRLPMRELVREKSLAIVRLMFERGLYAGDLEG